ncbi:MAG: hypothetical protein Q4G59_02790, partial [Planctomycetia bacterium]|nr:hypothetical protein [Planctomycetia bacterium]
MTETVGQRIVLFDIQEVFVYYSDADFQQKCEQGQDLSRSERWNQGRALLTTSREGTKTFETTDASVESIQQWIKKYNEQSSGAQLTKVIGLYQDSEKKRRIDLEFRCAQIPAERPAVCSWEFQRNEAKKDGGVSRMALRSVKSQIP